jgi:hypothetical protein
MIFNEHWNQVGKHAFLSASKYSWINYDEDKLVESYRNYLAVERGTELHAFAAKCIELGQKLPNTRAHLTLNEYVNDAIGYRMSPERVLYFSDNAFGTTDSITFRNNVLRIHDLKTGVTPAHMEQLEIYAAFFCLEYKKNPEDILARGYIVSWLEDFLLQQVLDCFTLITTIPLQRFWEGAPVYFSW